MFDYVNIIDNHPQDPAGVQLELEAEVVRLPVLEGVRVHQGPVELTRLRVDLQLLRVQGVGEGGRLRVLALHEECP